MPINSRQKGSRGERMLALRLREYGYETRRGQQYCGANGDADVVGLPGIHIECKFVDRLNIHEAMDQSARDSKDGEKPIVCHKKNYTDWLVTMKLEDWIELYREWESGHDVKRMDKTTQGFDGQVDLASVHHGAEGHFDNAPDDGEP